MWHKKYYRKIFAMFGLLVLLACNVFQLAAPKAGFLGTTVGDKGYQGYYLEVLMNRSSHTLNPEIIEDFKAHRNPYAHQEGKITDLDNYKYAADHNLAGSGNLDLGFSGTGGDPKNIDDIGNAFAKGQYILANSNSNGKDKAKKAKDAGSGDVQTAKSDASTRLLMTFPGNCGSQYTYYGGKQQAQRDVQSVNITQADQEKAMKISQQLVGDFNQALDLNYNLNVDTGAYKSGETLSYSQFAKLVEDTANLKFPGGVKVTTTYHPNSTKNYTAGSTTVNVKSDGGSSVSGINSTLTYQMLKGYIGKDDKYYKVDLYNSDKQGLDSDAKYLNWKDLALESISSWALAGYTYDNISQANNDDKFTQMMDTFFGNAIRALANKCGVAGIPDLIYNQHYRGSRYWWRGIMPISAHTGYSAIFWATRAAGMIMVMVGFALLIKRKAQSLTGWTSARVAWKEELYFIMFALFAIAVEGPVLDFATLVNVKFTNLMYDIAGSTNVNDFLANNYGFSAAGFWVVIISAIFFVFAIWYTIYYYGRMFFYIFGSVAMPIFYGYDCMFNNGLTTQRSSTGLWKTLTGIIFVQSFQAIFLTIFYLAFNSFLT